MHRIGDVVLGVFVGIAVNAVLVPPDYLSDARDLLVARTHEVADILRQMAARRESRCWKTGFMASTRSVGEQIRCRGDRGDGR